MNTYSEDWRLDWDSDLSVLLKNAEEAEQGLSYLSPCGSEAARKELGSYYTPADVSLFFWTEFLRLTHIHDYNDIEIFWHRHHFVEPSAGAGALIFALFKKGVEIGLSPQQIACIHLTVIDINAVALDFIREQISWLENRWSIVFSNINYECNDFRRHKLTESSRALLFFGNPPFVSNPRGSKWRNLFADFLERSISQGKKDGHCHFILPVSIAFSRDYAKLRQQMRGLGKSIAISSFDNIPDTLFPSGKPEHTNTNKANSQRCCILTIFPTNKAKILSTRMHRWGKNQRQQLLSSPPHYYDISDYDFDDQFPRPENEAILRYLDNTNAAKRFASLICKGGKHKLYVASVARNFIGFREEASSGVHCLAFDNKESMILGLLILSSDVFLNYWRSVGDGFHVTSANIMDFPLHTNFMNLITNEIPMGNRMWKNRKQFVKTKKHPKGLTTSYDFSTAALRLCP
jgi:hypothetical protein